MGVLAFPVEKNAPRQRRQNRWDRIYLASGPGTF
jgi:hypothetical protein